MAETPPPYRRSADVRLDKLEAKVDAVAVRVDEIRDWLIGEPESSALGRQLLQRAKDNRADISVLQHEVQDLQDWRTEWRGSWRLVTGIGTMLGVVATIVALLSYFR